MTQLKCKFQAPAMPGAGVASRPASNSRKKKEMAIKPVISSKIRLKVLKIHNKFTKKALFRKL